MRSFKTVFFHFKYKVVKAFYTRFARMDFLQKPAPMVGKKFLTLFLIGYTFIELTDKFFITACIYQILPYAVFHKRRPLSC